MALHITRFGAGAPDFSWFDGIIEAWVLGLLAAGVSTPVIDVKLAGHRPVHCTNRLPKVKSARADEPQHWYVDVKTSLEHEEQQADLAVEHERCRLRSEVCDLRPK